MKKMKSMLLIILAGALILSLHTLYRHATSKKKNIVAIAQIGNEILVDNKMSTGKDSEKIIVDSLGSKEQDRKELHVENVNPSEKAASRKLTPEMVKSIKPGKAYQFDSTGNFKEFEPEMWDGVSDLVPGKKYGFTLDLFDKFVEADIKRDSSTKAFWDSVKEFKKKMKEDAKKLEQK